MDTVKHDRASHYLDSFRYFSVYVEGRNPTGGDQTFSDRDMDWSRPLDYSERDNQICIRKSEPPYRPSRGAARNDPYRSDPW